MKNRADNKKSYISVINGGKIRKFFLNKDNSVDSVVEERMPMPGYNSYGFNAKSMFSQRF